MLQPKTARCGHCGRACPYCQPRRAPEGCDSALARCGMCGLAVPRVALSRHFTECGVAEQVGERDAVARMIGEGCPND